MKPSRVSVQVEPSQVRPVSDASLPSNSLMFAPSTGVPSGLYAFGPTKMRPSPVAFSASTSSCVVSSGRTSVPSTSPGPVQEKLSLTPTEFKLLYVFVKNENMALTRNLLLEKLWDSEGNFVDEHTLTINISTLWTSIL